MNKILVVNMNYVGDALMTTPSHTALRRAFPTARIDAIAGSGPDYGAYEVLRGNPDIDELIERRRGGPIRKCAQLLRLLRTGGYDCVVILPPIPAYRLTAALAGTPFRVAVTPLPKGVHDADHMLNALKPLFDRAAFDGFTSDLGLKMVVAPEAMQAARKALAGLSGAGDFVALNVGNSRPQKRWPADHFAQLALRLSEIGRRIVILGGPGPEDQEDAARIAASLPSSSVLNMAGRTSRQELAGVIALSNVVVSGDSGAMHIASALGTPVVAIFGSTDPRQTGPYGHARSTVIYKRLACSPCDNHPTCNAQFQCLGQITPDEVLLAVNDLLRQTRASGRAIPVASVSTAQRSNQYRRILVATKYRFIGDTILAIPALRALARRWPEARITVLTGARAREVLLNCPYVHEVIEFDPYRASDQGWSRYAWLVGDLRKRRFDLSIVLNRSFHSVLTAALGGAAFRASWSGFERRDFLLQAKCPYRSDGNEIDCYLDIVRAVAGRVADDDSLELWISEQEKESAGRSLGAGGAAIGLQPGASHLNKRWPAPNYAALAEKLLNEDPTRRIVLIGGPDERSASYEVQQAAPPHIREKMIDCVGAFDLRGALALLTHMSAFVGNDTAIRHGAVALNVPSVALFGPTSVQKWGNERPPRHIVLCSSTHEMSDLPVEHVFQECQAVLSTAQIGELVDA